LRPGQVDAELREMPKEPHLIRRLFQRLTREGSVRACYEAGVSGYDLYRQITACEVECQVIAPALTPRRAGQRIKTDWRDAGKLVRLFRAGELTPIHVPDEAEEAVRDLVRCREDAQRDVLRWRHRLLKFLDRHGRLYVTGKNWTHQHWAWIRGQHFDLPVLQRTFEATLFALEQALARVADGRPGRYRTVSRRGRVAALLPRHRHAVGDDPRGGDRGLPALSPPARVDGLLGPGAERVFFRRDLAPGCHHQGR